VAPAIPSNAEIADTLVLSRATVKTEVANSLETLRGWRPRSSHATARHHATSHPINRPLEPGEDWCWCLRRRVGFVLKDLRGTTRIPPSPLLS
jgi:hypothetical protein